MMTELMTDPEPEVLKHATATPNKPLSATGVQHLLETEGFCSETKSIDSELLRLIDEQLSQPVFITKDCRVLDPAELTSRFPRLTDPEKLFDRLILFGDIAFREGTFRPQANKHNYKSDSAVCVPTKVYMAGDRWESFVNAKAGRSKMPELLTILAGVVLAVAMLYAVCSAMH